jgi:hypothetical protein
MLPHAHTSRSTSQDAQVHEGYAFQVKPLSAKVPCAAHTIIRLGNHRGVILALALSWAPAASALEYYVGGCAYAPARLLNHTPAQTRLRAMSVRASARPPVFNHTPAQER